MNTVIDDTLRDLLEDAAYRLSSPDLVADEWIAVAHHGWTPDQVATLWADFADAVDARDAIDLQHADFHRWFDARDLNAPRHEHAVQVMAQRADDAFVSLLRGPTFTRLHADAA